jgi:hypothetical protein
MWAFGVWLVLIAALATVFALDVGGLQTFMTTSFGMSPKDGGNMVLAMALAPFPFDPVLAAIVVAYRNAKAIADAVLPRVLVGRQTFEYNKYDRRETFTIPNTLVGRKGTPDQVEFSATKAEASCDGHGLDDYVPQDDIDNAPAGYNPVNIAVEGIAELLTLSREKRAADLVFSADTYGASNKVQLSGNHQWSVVHADSNPIPDINTGLDACVLRPNVMVIGAAAWVGLRTNAYIMKAINRTSGDSGMAKREEIAELFELDEVLVGMSLYNTAKKGQTASLSRLWGKHCSLIYRDKSVQDPRGKVTFGLTAQWGPKVAGTIPEPKVGLKGSTLVRAGEYIKELVSANDLGYFIQDCVA